MASSGQNILVNVAQMRLHPINWYRQDPIRLGNMSMGAYLLSAANGLLKIQIKLGFPGN
jgi:hypothetical protein